MAFRRATLRPRITVRMTTLMTKFVAASFRTSDDSRGISGSTVLANPDAIAKADPGTADASGTIAT